MPLLRGYSKNTIAKNIKRLIGEGYPRKQAIAIAYNEARKWAPIKAIIDLLPRIK